MRHGSRIESFQNADGGNGSLQGGFPAQALCFMVRSFTAAVLRREEQAVIHSLAHQSTHFQVYVSVSRRADEAVKQTAGGCRYALVTRYAH
jgi:hypothetical protein